MAAFQMKRIPSERTGIYGRYTIVRGVTSLN